MLRGQSSVSRKPRAGASALKPLPCRRTRLRYYSDDDDDDDGSHGQDNGFREEDEQKIRGESSVGRKRTCSSARHAPPLPRRTPQRYYYEDDDDDDNFIDEGRWDDDDREEDEQQRGSGDERGSSAPAPPPEPSPPSSSLSDSSSVIRNVTVENSSVFDCSICCLPLKSPIFQCTVGHVVCSPCHDKLGQATRCHVCRVPTPDGYSRCNAMEQAVVDSIRVPCPHAAHSCAERLGYQDRDAHAATCVHKPCRCPADGCGFAGSVQTMLLEHFAAVHGWPCSAGNTGLPSFCVRLRMGFNVVTAGATTGDQYILVLNVYQAAPVFNAISAFCIHPRNTGTVSLNLHYYRYSNSDLCTRYIQTTVLNVVCTDLSNGVPGCRHLPLPKWSATEGEDDHIDMRLTVDHTCGMR